MRRAALLCFVLAMGTIFAVFGAEERIEKKFSDNCKALINPSMGWTMFHYSGDTVSYSIFDPDDVLEGFDGCSTVYLRLNWADIQRAEHFIDWSILDSVAQRWISKGKKVALRFNTSATGSAGYAGTPEWVHKAGAKMVPIEFRGTVSMEPIFDDPVFLEKLETFLAAAGRRYNGNPDIAFIDIGTFGTWGEGHTIFTHKLSEEETARQVRIHAALFLKYFPDTLLAISDDVIGHNKPGDDFPLMKELREKGITFRDDSILVGKNWYHEALAQHYWPKMPVILEHEHLRISIDRNNWSNEKLLEAVEKHHASYLSIHSYPEHEKKILGDYLEKINLRLGYRLQVWSVNYPAVIKPGEMFTIESEIANAGVAPCYPGGFLAFTLKDPVKGSIVSVLADESFDLRELAVGPAGTPPVRRQKSRLRINPRAPKIPGGVYDLFLSVGDRIGTPRIALPLDQDDGRLRYKIGQIKVDSDFVGLYQGQSDWIWDRKTSEPDCRTWVTRQVELDSAPVSAVLRFAIDDAGDAFVNGEKLETGKAGWAIMREAPIELKKGINLIALEGLNHFASCGILAEIIIRKADGTTEVISSDGKWRASREKVPGWETDPKISAGWPTAAVTASHSEAGGRKVLIYKR